ncbi:hypothetical protein HY386_02005 [Candidatus Daviesbacteria bacterium]|nr:hypothetical protein [Candidatus Daviesbacteria bacterium]
MTGISDPNGWPNVALYRDGATADYCWGGITNPWPTFIYNCVPSGTSGTHNLVFTVQPSGRSRYSCTPTQNFTTQNITPSNLQVSGVPACASGPFNVTLSWTNTNSTLWADISTNGFASYSNKNVSNQTSTAAPAGFNPGLTLNPNTTYQWRLWNGSVHTVGPSFIAPFCPGNILGRLWKDDNGNGVWDGGEQLIRNSAAACGGYTSDNAWVNFAGPWSGTKLPNLCNPDPYYDTGAIPPGSYTVDPIAPAGWIKPAAITVNLTAGVSEHRWFGLIPPPPCTNTSPGTNQLTGCLWDGVNFNTPDGNAPDGVSLPSPVPDTIYALNQDWGTGQPNSFVGADTFSARWRGNFTFKAGTYTFYAGADDGVRVRIDGVTVLDDWRDTGYFERSFSRSFATAGVHLVEIDYYENGGDARASLRWSYTLPVQSWIQTIGGDVHSNTRINTPGGP